MYAIRSYYATAGSAGAGRVRARARGGSAGRPVEEIFYERRTEPSVFRPERRQRAARIPEAAAGRVITSYSIHYTKLYDKRLNVLC